MGKTVLLLLLLLVLLMLAAEPASARRQCQLKNGQGGVCRPVKSCSAAREAAKRGESITYCHRKKSTLTICCPETSAVGEKATKMCAKYAEAVFIKRLSPVLLPERPTEVANTCPMKAVPLVVGGVEAGQNEFPHMALLGKRPNLQSKTEWFCGGSLISERYILTAAHCVTRVRAAVLVVRLGERDVTNENEKNKHEDFGVEKVIRNPRFRMPYFDAALLRLSRDVKFSASIRPACLNTVAAINRKGAVASGWGKTDWADDELSGVLMKVNLTLYDETQCIESQKRAFRQQPSHHGESMLCAGNLAGGQDTCEGDSGGPLQTKHDEHYCMYSIIGITSFGPLCGASNVLAVYSRVSYFVPWIESIVWPGGE